VHSKRIEAIDLARGFAIALMILSHGVKGLLAFESFPTWGLVPIHLVTKFSSSLFILVFGASLALIYLPHVGTPRWSEKRRKLMVRGITVLFWYKVLTVVELFHLHPRNEILDTLLYKSFPSYVEILGFYGLALLWIPYALHIWKYTPLALRVMVPATLWYATNWLTAHPEYFATPQLQALLIEHDDFYTWGQLSRAPLVFLGLLMGQAMRSLPRSFNLSSLLMITGGFLFTGFCFVVWPDFSEAFHAVALNQGKHPPELPFMLFSLSGAFFVIGACLHGGNLWARRLSPVTILGKDSLGAFVFHIAVLFIVYRFLLDYWLKISYINALGLALALIVMTAAWIKVKQWATQ